MPLCHHKHVGDKYKGCFLDNPGEINRKIDPFYLFIVFPSKKPPSILGLGTHKQDVPKIFTANRPFNDSSFIHQTMHGIIAYMEHRLLVTHEPLSKSDPYYA